MLIKPRLCLCSIDEMQARFCLKKPLPFSPDSNDCGILRLQRDPHITGLRNRQYLFRCFAVHKESDGHKNNIGYPCGYQRRQMSLTGEDNGETVHDNKSCCGHDPKGKV